jgi:hypothetical protein
MEISSEMMEMTTSNSMSVKARASCESFEKAL